MTPDHLTPIELTPSLRFLLERTAYRLAPKHRTTWQELRAFRDTLTPHDGRRLVGALRFAAGLPKLADELEMALSVRQEPVQRDLAAGRGRSHPNRRAS